MKIRNISAFWINVVWIRQKKKGLIIKFSGRNNVDRIKCANNSHCAI